VAIGLWIVCEQIAIAACDLLKCWAAAGRAEAAVWSAAAGWRGDHRAGRADRPGAAGRGFRLIEALSSHLIASIAACFAYEIFFAQPIWREAAVGFIPRMEILRNREMLYIAIGILGPR